MSSLLGIVHYTPEVEDIKEGAEEFAIPSQAVGKDGVGWIAFLAGACIVDGVATVNTVANLAQFVETEDVGSFQLLLLGSAKYSVPQVELFCHGISAVWIYQVCLIEHHGSEAFSCLKRV